MDFEYKKTIEKESIEMLGFEIPNSTLEHAILVQTKLIENTRNSLSIMTSVPCELEYKEIIHSIEALAQKFRQRNNGIGIFYYFLNKFKKDKRPREIRILFCGEEGNKGNFYDFARMHGDVIKIKKFKNPNPLTPHFLVSDSVRYREEETHDKEALTDYNIRAKANFNDKLNASILEQLFNMCWKCDNKLISVQ